MHELFGYGVDAWCPPLSFFLNAPLPIWQIFAYGMFGAAVAIAIVLFVATYLKQAVSTTHTASECLQ